MDRNRYPAARCLSDFRRFDAEETRDRRTCKIDVEDSNGVASEGEGEGELGGNGRLSDPAFA